MNKIKYTTALLLGGLLSFSSCTDNFADFNSTDGAYTEELQKYANPSSGSARVSLRQYRFCKCHFRFGTHRL